MYEYIWRRKMNPTLGWGGAGSEGQDQWRFGKLLWHATKVHVQVSKLRCQNKPLLLLQKIFLEKHLQY